MPNNGITPQDPAFDDFDDFDDDFVMEEDAEEIDRSDDDDFLDDLDTVLADD